MDPAGWTLAPSRPVPHDYFGPDVAPEYDDETDERFTPAHLELETGFLAGHAGPGGRALELAIGTGRVALPLMERGVEVVGIDLSEAMLAQLRVKPGAAITTLVGDFSTTAAPGAGSFGLAYLVFNTINNVVTQDGQVATFRNAARHLRAGGRFVVETHVPGVQGTAPGERYRVFDHTETHVGLDEYDAATQLFYSHHLTLRPDGTYRSTSVPFRYVWPAELDLMARIAGLRLAERWAWWTARPSPPRAPRTSRCERRRRRAERASTVVSA